MHQPAAAEDNRLADADRPAAPQLALDDPAREGHQPPARRKEPRADAIAKVEALALRRFAFPGSFHFLSYFGITRECLFHFHFGMDLVILLKFIWNNFSYPTLVGRHGEYFFLLYQFHGFPFVLKRHIY